MKQVDKDSVTRERILDTAEGLFAEKGFHAVSVRQITGKADCNLSAINYHFGNKENLYLEVFRSRVVPRAQRIRGAFRKILEENPPKSPEGLIRAVALSFIKGPLTDEERRRHVQLISKEMDKPSEAFELVADQMMRPFIAQFGRLLQGTLPKTLEKERLMLLLFSIFSQVLYFTFAGPVIRRITGRDYDEAFKNSLVDHITAFCLNGINGAGGEGAK